MSRLITASLISSVDWFRTCPPSWKERAYQDLKNSLGREAWKPTVAIKKGIAFENDVYNIIDGKAAMTLDEVMQKASDNFKLFLSVCNGGEFQNKNKEYVDIDGEEYCLYVKEDVLFAPGSEKYPDGHIIDIKTSKKWGGKSKYLNTWQHKLYCMVEKIPTFQYIVAIWKDADNESDKSIASVHYAAYKVEDFEALREEVITKVKNVISFLQADDELWQLYLDKFCLY